MYRSRETSDLAYDGRREDPFADDHVGDRGTHQILDVVGQQGRVLHSATPVGISEHGTDGEGDM